MDWNTIAKSERVCRIDTNVVRSGLNEKEDNVKQDVPPAKSQMRRYRLQISMQLKSIVHAWCKSQAAT